MTQFFERHLRLIKKDQDLQRLFEAADQRRKLLLQNDNRKRNISADDESESSVNYLLRPLRSTENLIQKDKNDNKVKFTSVFNFKNSQKNNTYFSYQHLPETNLDNEEFSLVKTDQNPNNNQEICPKSVDNVSKSGYHNSSFAASSSSSDEIDTSNYCQFYPATSSSNNTDSSHFSRNFQGNSTNVDDPLKSVGKNQPEPEIENCYNRRSSVLFYPSGSPLISHKYQGSPVVRIDNKIRAGEVDYLVDVPNALHGKPPAIPRRQQLYKNPVNFTPTDKKQLSQPNLDHINEDNKPCSSSVSPGNAHNMQSTIIRRTKKKLLEDHMLKRFSTGDYSTRSLIEWENNLNLSSIQQLSISGDLQTENTRLSRQLSCDPNSQYPLSMSDQLHQMNIIHNYTSEINILHYSSTESFKDTQVSFSLKNPSIESKDKSKRSGFIPRSLNDIFMAFKNATASEKTPGSRKFLFSSNKSNFYFKHHRKRGSITSDFLYSVPPFARRHLPPDISGGTKISSQDTYQTTNLPSSTPNLIAELDPTFHERNISKETQGELPNVRHPNSKRNRSYRLSFIENAHTVTTKKLTSTNLTSPTKTLVPRFVQPRRRSGYKNASMFKKSTNHKGELVNSRFTSFRSHSSNRFSCTQQ